MKSLRIKTFGQRAVADGHKAWRKVLKSWAQHMSTYMEEIKDPAPYAYGERASVGLLTAGIVRSNSRAVAIEEYACGRYGEDGEEEQRGRADLWAVLGSTSYLLEAKQIWPSAQTDAPFFGNVRKVLDSALEQAQGYTDTPNNHVAAVFVVPIISRGNEIDAGDVAKTIRVEQVGLGSHSGFRADYYPQEDRPDPTADAYRYPGVTLFLSIRNAY